VVSEGDLPGTRNGAAAGQAGIRNRLVVERKERVVTSACLAEMKPEMEWILVTSSASSKERSGRIDTILRGRGLRFGGVSAYPACC
jgi:hypothetical protein